MELSIEMSEYIRMQIMNCFIKSSPILTGHVFIKVVLMKLVHYSQFFFIEFAKLSIPFKILVVREDDKPRYDSEIRRNSRKRDRLKKKAFQSGNSNDWNKYKFLRNKVNNNKNMRRNYFIMI